MLNSHSQQWVTVLIMVCSCFRVSFFFLLVLSADHVFFLIVCSAFRLANAWAMCVPPPTVTISASDWSPYWRNMLLCTSASFSWAEEQGDHIVIFFEWIFLVQISQISSNILFDLYEGLFRGIWMLFHCCAGQVKYFQVPVISTGRKWS